MSNQSYQDIDVRTYNFAVRIIEMVLKLPNNVVAWKLGGQIVNSATSINSNVV